MKADVVIIDSGVNDLLESKIIGGVNLSGVGSKDDIHDSIGHGSSILNLILAKNPEASVYMIKVCNDYNGFSFDKLCSALEYIVSSNIVCKILNISMGIVRLDNYARLHDLIVRIRNRGTVIVSAYSNQGIISYPAGFEEVIGVDCSPTCAKRDEFEYIENSIINVRASSAYFHAFDADERKILANGTSYASANLSAILLKNIACSTGEDFYCQCIAFLRKFAMLSNPTLVSFDHMHPGNCDCSLHNSRSSEEIRLPEWSSIRFSKEKPKAVVFPFNKEIHSMARFESMLNLDIVGFYDYRISINNNKSIRTIVGSECNDRIISPISDLDWSSDFELFVCGHCNEMHSLAHDNSLHTIIANCMKHGKKLYCFDDPRQYLGGLSHDKIGDIYSPYVDKQMIKPNRFDKLRKSAKPVIGVYGTSSRQGKYTLQLFLRRALQKKKYKVGQLGTEPHGYLFGFDYVYPMGYNSSVYVDGYDAIRILNEAMWDIERKDPDIIITGCQSSTVPYNVNIMTNLNFSSYEFLIGTAPDAVVLCVNPFDSVHYIEKSIKFIESVGNAKVIALVLFPVNRKDMAFINQDMKLNNGEIERKIDFLSSSTQIKTYLNSRIGAESLSEDIIQFFA